jgi:hypothetical protein
VVKAIMSLFGCMVLSAVTGAAELRIEGVDAQVEMGKYLNLQIVYEGESAVGSADLQQWADDFHIDLRDRDSESLLNGDVRTTQRLRLYPRQPGEAVLQRIALGGAVAGPLRVDVVPAERDGIDGTPRWLPLPDRVWQGQAFEIGVDVALMHPSNHIALEDALLPGFDAWALPRQLSTRDDVDVVQLRWTLTAFTSGRHRLSLPPIEQRGRGRWKFFLRAKEIRVVPVPSYLPPSVPVGKVTLESALIDGDGQRHWQVVVHSRGRLPEVTYGMRAALADAAGIDVDRVEVSDIETNAVTRIALQRYRVPVPDWSFGRTERRSVSLRYFDTDVGQLTEVQTRLPAVWRLPNYAGITLVVIGVLLLVYLSRRSWRLIRHLLARRQFRQALAKAPDAHALRCLLIKDGGHYTLSEWAVVQGDPVATRTAALINKACFSAATPPDLAELKQTLRHPRLL